VEPNHTPCNTTQTNSACCLPQDSCTAQGLCLGTSNFNYRGSCTDKTWQSNSCPQTCRQGKSQILVMLSLANGSIDPFTKQPYGVQTPIISCSGPGAIPNEFCCNSVGRNCCSIAPFGLGSTGNAFSHGLDQLVLNLRNAQNGISSSSSSSASSPASSSKNSTPAKPSNALSVASTVGLAIGLPLGALVVGILSFLFWREKRRSTKQKISRGGIIVDPGKRAYFEPGPPPKPPVDLRKSSTWGSSRSNSRTNTMRDMPIIPERPKPADRRAGVRVDLI
jgi:hypothetical protein